MPASTNSKKLFVPIPAFDPAKRTLAIQNAIAKGDIKRTAITDDILVLLYQLIERQEKQIA
jgi:hypothetical protein